MLSIFNFTNYREYLSEWIKGHGPQAHGLKGRMATALKVSSSLISQMLKGEKSLTSEQTFELCEFIGLSEFESEYLHLIVEWDRAGTLRYKEKLQRKIASMQKQSQRLEKRIQRVKPLSDEQRAIFYSSWLFSGIRNLTAVPGMDSAGAIAEYLKLEPGVVHRVLRFLLENGLCEETNGTITYATGSALTHVEHDSPFVNKHHQNWRFQAIQNMEKRSEDDFFLTSPLSLSHEAAAEIRKRLPTFVHSILKISMPSASEKTVCLNIDWFKY